MNGDTEQWWKISRRNWTDGERRKTWQPKKNGMNIGQHGQLKSHWTKRKKKARRGKRYDTKEEAEAAAGDDRDRDPDYVQLEEDSSMDPTYEPSRKELRRADEEGDK